MVDVLVHGLKQRVGGRLSASEGVVYLDLACLAGLPGARQAAAVDVWSNPYKRPAEMAGMQAAEAIGRIEEQLASAPEPPLTAPLFAICDRCGTVFRRSRRDYKQTTCPAIGGKSSPCANSPLPSLEASSFNAPGWLQVERRQADDASPPKIRVEAYCREPHPPRWCGESGSWVPDLGFFWANDASDHHCPAHSTPAARKARERRLKQADQ